MVGRALRILIAVLVLLSIPHGMGAPVEGPKESCGVPSASSFVACVDWSYDWAHAGRDPSPANHVLYREGWAKQQILTADGSLLIVAGSTGAPKPVARAFDALAGKVVWEHVFAIPSDGLYVYDQLFIDASRGLVILVANFEHESDSWAETYGISVLELATGKTLFETVRHADDVLRWELAADYDALRGRLLVVYNQYLDGYRPLVTTLDTWDIDAQRLAESFRLILPINEEYPFSLGIVWKVRMHDDLAFIDHGDELLMIRLTDQRLVWTFDCPCYPWELVPGTDPVQIVTGTYQYLSLLDGMTGSTKAGLRISHLDHLAFRSDGTIIISTYNSLMAIAPDLSEVLWTQLVHPSDDHVESGTTGLAYQAAADQVVSISSAYHYPYGNRWNELTYYDATTGAELHTFAYYSAVRDPEWFMHLDVDPSGTAYAGGTAIIRYSLPTP